MARKEKGLRVASSGVESVRQYAVAGVVTVITVWLLYRYAVVRYGVGGLSPLNKSFATSTVFLLGVVLLMGPLSRLFTIFDPFLKYRKELGILTFFTGASHVYLSMFPLARRGPFGFYQSRPLPAYAGLAGIAIMAFLFLISFAPAERALGARLWWKLQYWGARFAFVAISFHMIVLEYAGWGKWFARRSSPPPLALLASVFATFVLAVRLSELFGAAAARRITQFSFLAMSAIMVWLFR